MMSLRRPESAVGDTPSSPYVGGGGVGSGSDVGSCSASDVGSGSAARWEPTWSSAGAAGSGEAGARCSVHADPSQYRWPPEPSGSGYQPAGVDGVVTAGE